MLEKQQDEGKRSYQAAYKDEWSTTAPASDGSVGNNAGNWVGYNHPYFRNHDDQACQSGFQAQHGGHIDGQNQGRCIAQDLPSNLAGAIAYICGNRQKICRPVSKTLQETAVLVRQNGMLRLRNSGHITRKWPRAGA